MYGKCPHHQLGGTLYKISRRIYYDPTPNFWKTIENESCWLSFLEIEAVYYFLPMLSLGTQVYPEFLHPVFIVCSINQKIGEEILEATLMIHRDKCMLYNIYWSSEKKSCLIRNTSIGELMLSDEICSDFSFFWENNRRVIFLCYTHEGIIFFIENNGNIWFYDASLFSGNLYKSIPKELHVIIRNARNNRENRGDNIGRIESPTHSHLDYRILTSAITKIEKCKHNTLLVIR